MCKHKVKIMDEEFPEFIIKLNLEFSAIRVVKNRLEPTTWKLAVELIYDDYDENETEDQAETSDLAIKVTIAKIKYWLEHVVTNSVIFAFDNEWAALNFFDEDGICSIANNVMVLPKEPSDDTIAEILQAKFNAFGGDNLGFGLVELTSTNKNNLSYMFTGSGYNNLPLMNEWIGDIAFHKEPWWNRDDATTTDSVPEDEEALNNPPVTPNLDFVRSAILMQSGRSATVVRPSFRPQVITGRNE